ncbi:MAG: hypothetical protein JWO53_976 [Chlamydiia bacterium]|nr:hypothetical protein [Chlamydiia bacterium]
MKYTNWQAFDAVLKQNMPHLILLLIKDEFELDEAFKSIKKRFFKEVKEIAVDQIAQELASISLFRDASTKSIQHLEQLKAGELEPLDRYINSGVKQDVLFLTATTLPAALIKKIEANGIIFEVPEVKPWEKQARVQDWIVRYCAKEGKTIHREAAFILAREFVADRQLLKEEMDKLLTYAINTKEIVLKDVQEIVTLQQKTVLWQMSDALLQRNVELSLTILKGLEGSDIHALQILRYLRNQLHNALEVALLSKEGVSQEEMMKRFPLVKGKNFEKLLDSSQRFGAAALAKAQLLVDTLEVDLKNTQQDEQLSLEMLLCSICSLTS